MHMRANAFAFRAERGAIYLDALGTISILDDDGHWCDAGLDARAMLELAEALLQVAQPSLEASGDPSAGNVRFALEAIARALEGEGEKEREG